MVPVSLPTVRPMLGKALEPWKKLFHSLTGFGWNDAEKLEARLLEVLA